MTEIWLPVIDFEDEYSVSNQARVRSESRIIELSNGNHRRIKERILSQHLDPEGYVRVTLARDGELYSKLIHTLMLESFIGPRPTGLCGLHWDDDRLNNDLANLRWGTRSENGRDAVRNGRNPNTLLTECINGHKFTPENTGYQRNGRKRRCRRCAVISSTQSRLKAKQKAATA